MTIDLMITITKNMCSMFSLTFKAFSIILNDNRFSKKVLIFLTLKLALILNYFILNSTQKKISTQN
jgi:hypothetical protein